MSAPDMLAIGETFAEIDLVVRQLDDGSLTLTRDDALPDEERVRVLATEPGLRAVQCAATYSGEPPAALTQALEELGAPGPCEWTAQNGRVWCGRLLPWLAQRPHDGSELNELYRSVSEAVSAQRERLGKLARGEPAEEPSEPPAGPPAMPPSYLAGAGQKDGEGLTRRYGATEGLPGRPDLPSSERLRRAPPPPPRSGGFPVGLCLVVGLLLAALAAGGGVLAWTLVAPRPAPEPLGVSSPADSGDEDEEDYEDEYEEGEVIDIGAVPRFDSGTPAATPRERSTPPPVATRSREELLALAASASAEDRHLAVKRWLARGFDQVEGGRFDLLQAMDGRLERDAGLLLLESCRKHPLSPFEALDCLDYANTAITRHLLGALGRPGLPNAEAIAEILAERPDTPDLLIEEALIRLGHPKPGAAERLIAKRGVAWARVERGEELLQILLGHGLEHLDSLIASPSEERRLLACDLLAGAKDDSKAALKRVLPLLRDELPAVRQRAIECMNTLGNPQASWPLARALRSEEDGFTASRLQDALSRLPADTTARMLGALYQKKRAEDRHAAVLGAKAMNKAQAVPILIRALGDAERDLQLEAVKALQTAQRHSALRDAVAAGLSTIRKLALETQDREIRRVARQLHQQMTGRFPQR